MMMGVIVGVILGVIVGVIVPVIVSMVMSVLVSVLVSMIVVVVVVVIVITSSEQLLQIGSGVHHIDRREAYDYQMAKHSVSGSDKGKIESKLYWFTTLICKKLNE